MSKREARIARRNAKSIGQHAKSSRLRERPIETKQVRVGADPGSIYQMQVTWSCDSPDCDDEWSWGPRTWSDETWVQVIKPKLDGFSCLTWGEIDRFSSDSGHKMHHLMEVGSLCDEAQYRLIEIDKLQDNIFRFRLANKPRLWGFRTVAHFEVLWFDPEHKIYPTDPS